MRQYPDDIMHMIKTELHNRKDYFKNAEKEIASSNLKFLIAANISALVFLIGFILLMPYIIKGWKPTGYHIGFIPALLFCTFITFIYYIRRNWQYRTVSILCVMFSAVLLVFSILLDTIGTPDGPGTFLPMMFIIIPSLFTLPFSISYGLIVSAEILYIAVVIISKNNILGQYDIFSSIVALAFSTVIANMIMILRVRDYTLQTKYKYRTMQNNLRRVSQIETGMQITGSFGIVLVDGQNIDSHALFLQADEALYEAKNKGKATYVIKQYQPDA